MTAEVHRLTGAGPISEPVQPVIEMIRDLLGRAERGEVKGLGYFLVDGADAVVTDWAAGIACGNDMSAGASRLQYRVIKALDDD